MDEIEQIKTEPPLAKHPKTNFGEMSLSDDGTKMRCHICGGWTTDMVIHLRNEHHMNPNRYREIYKIPSEVRFGLVKPIEATEQEIESYNSELR